MNRERAKELAPIIKAFGDGEDIQYGPIHDDTLCDAGEYCDFRGKVKYYIKPKPLMIYARVVGGKPILIKHDKSAFDCDCRPEEIFGFVQVLK